MIRRMALLFILLMSGAILISGCTTDTGPTTPTPTATTPAGNVTPTTTPAPAGQTIAEMVAEGERFETLAAALDAANLTEILDGQGPFTLFAPTDDAFEELPDGTVEALLADPEGDLRTVLLYHLVPGEYTAAEVANLTTLETVEGSNLTINVTGGQVTVDGAVAIVPDLQAENGIIHAIDAVMMPPSVDITVNLTAPTPTPTTGTPGGGGGY
ncbi:MAG: fasciclin domain-containing protein [Methanomicrobiales archaeon]|nr:fasciclin domain-containing protein [Methanomicrobiales archaeon]